MDIETNPLPTIGKPLPDDMQPLLGSFIEKLGERDIPVRFETLPASVGGYANHHTKVIGLAKGFDSRISLATLIHEVAHLMMHSDPDTRSDLQIRELEAESVSFVMSEILGLEYSVSADYLLDYRVMPDQVKTTLDRIQRTVKQLVKLLDIVL